MFPERGDRVLIFSMASRKGRTEGEGGGAEPPVPLNDPNQSYVVATTP